MAAGALVGGGLFVLVRGLLAPPPPRLARRLDALYRPPATEGLDHLRWRWQAAALRALAAAGAQPPSLHSDLAVCGTSLERHAMAKLAFATLGATAPVAVSVVWGAVAPRVAKASLAMAWRSRLVPHTACLLYTSPSPRD